MSSSEARRPLKTRNKGWAKALGRALARAGVTPNQISVGSIVASLLAFGAFWLSRSANGLGRLGFLLAAAVFIQLRLLANMLDGLVAIESGKQTVLGPLYNEIPDRIDDAVILGGAGLALGTTWGLALGLLCALLAVGTAYVRLLAGSLGLPQRFLGPCAKQHRMFLLTVTTLGAAVDAALGGNRELVLWGGLLLIALLTAGTLVRRVSHMSRDLRA